MNIAKQLYKSLYSPKDISSFRFQGIGKTIFYVFVIAFVSILPSAVFFSTSISTGISTVKSVVKEQFPPFTIKNGQLSAKTSIPVMVTKNNFTIILDPTGAVSEKELTSPNNTFALLKNQFVFVSGGKSENFGYASLQGMQITNQKLLNFLDTLDSLKSVIIPAFALIIYLSASAAKFIEITIIALSGLAIKNLMHKRLQYGQLWKMAAYSGTLPTLFFTIMNALKTTVPSSYIIYWFVTLIVFCLAVNETPAQKKKD